MSQITRIWFGTLLASRKDEYLEYVKETGVKGLRGTSGNLGVLILTRTREQIVEIGVISFWSSAEAIRKFAGENIEKAVYYPKDSEFLLWKEPILQHFEINLAEGFQLDSEQNKGGSTSLIARVWFGSVLASRKNDYLEFVGETGLKDLTETSGNRGVLIMTRTREQVVENGIISFWSSTDAIRCFAGEDIDKAVYYPAASELLLWKEPTLRHFEVVFAEGVEFH